MEKFGVRYREVVMSGLLLMLFGGWAGAQEKQEKVDEPVQAISGIFAQQVTDWNRGDLVAFTKAYKRGPDIVFIGPDVQRGYDNILRNFQHSFPTQASMGQLSFSQVDVQPIDTRYATATAHMHLHRSAQNGGDLDGYFMVLFVKLSQGWKIVRDASTLLPSK